VGIIFSNKKCNMIKPIALFGLFFSVCEFAEAQWNTSGTNIYNTNSGNVGIGTNTPAYILEVRKDQAGVTNMGIRNLLSGNNTARYDLSTYSPNSYVLSALNENNGSPFYQFSVGSAITSAFFDAPEFNWRSASGSNYLKIANNGNVGIGTTSPVSSLDVYWPASSTLQQGLFLHSGSFGTSTNAANSYFLKMQDDGNGVTKFLVRGDGSVGIGTATPSNKLTVATGSAGDGIWVTGVGTTNLGLFNNMTQGAWNALTQPGDNMLLWKGSAPDNSNAGGFVIAPWSNSNPGIGIRISPAGYVGIGTSDTKGYQLAVNGSAIFTKAVVKLYPNWPDYVFKKEYHLPSLDSVAAYIQRHQHLPEMPSADSVAKDGLDLGSNQAALLKKIEELTLYIIKQNEGLKAQQERIDRLEKLVEQQNKK